MVATIVPRPLTELLHHLKVIILIPCWPGSLDEAVTFMAMIIMSLSLVVIVSIRAAKASFVSD